MSVWKIYEDFVLLLSSCYLSSPLACPIPELLWLWLVSLSVHVDSIWSSSLSWITHVLAVLVEEEDFFRQDREDDLPKLSLSYPKPYRSLSLLLFLLFLSFLVPLSHHSFTKTRHVAFPALDLEASAFGRSSTWIFSITDFLQSKETQALLGRRTVSTSNPSTTSSRWR